MRSAWLVAALLTTQLLSPKASAGRRCAFNGVWEGCTLECIMSKGRQIGTKVNWLNDGKVINYYDYGCTGEEFGGPECKTKIIEDNGQVTYGISVHSERGSLYTSNRDNKTHIPPFQ